MKAIQKIKLLLPFALLGISPTTAASLSVAHLIRYCHEHHIQFTGSRPYRKNDNCFIEQKNNSVVWPYVGYMRYEGEEQVALLNELYDQLRLFANFFQPSMKLIYKVRQGSNPPEGEIGAAEGAWTQGKGSGRDGGAVDAEKKAQSIWGDREEKR